jgi:hypothetical protein
MDSIKATWTNGQIMPSEPVVWREGTELVVEPALGDASIGLHESQWRDDPQAIADWERWLASLELRELTEQEQADFAAYEVEQRRFNSEAMHRRACRD